MIMKRDTFHLVAIGLKAAFSIEVIKIVCVYFVLVKRRTSLKFDHYDQKDYNCMNVI